MKLNPKVDTPDIMLIIALIKRKPTLSSDMRVSFWQNLQKTLTSVIFAHGNYMGKVRANKRVGQLKQLVKIRERVFSVNEKAKVWVCQWTDVLEGWTCYLTLALVRNCKVSNYAVWTEFLSILGWENCTCATIKLNQDVCL